MTITEAARASWDSAGNIKTKWLWFRPMSWRGRGEAYGIMLGRIQRFPQRNGCRSVGIGESPSELFGEWEVVEAGVVNAENANNKSVEEQAT